MKFEQSLIKAGSGLYKQVQKQEYAKYKPVWKAILAQWVLESGWGESKLAKLFNNFGGMKFRYGIAIGLRAFVVDIFDWNSEGDKYFALRNPSDYAELYFDFIQRPRYQNVILTHDMQFLTTLADAGYVEKMPDGNGGIIEGEELPMYYANKIIEIKNSKRFKELIKQVLKESEKEQPPEWLNIGFFGAI